MSNARNSAKTCASMRSLFRVLSAMIRNLPGWASNTRSATLSTFCQNHS
jgi:hypothetical protein